KGSTISDGLTNLISSQHNLKELSLYVYYEEGNWTKIIPSLTKHDDTLTKLHLYSDRDDLSLSFVALFPNLQEIKFSFVYGNPEAFRELQNITFPKLEILKIPYPLLEAETL